MPEQKQPYRVCRVGGRVFSINLEYVDQLKESHPVYPDFSENPEYTEEGRPFATAEQESCQWRKPKITGEPMPFDCGGCSWFFREQTPCDPIGVCMSDALHLKVKSESEEMK